MHQIFNKLNKKNKKLHMRHKKAKKNIISSHNTLFIFDWDDTLYPTSWKDKRKNKNYDLCLLDEKICSFIQKIISFGKISIISNASLSWIKDTMNHIPKTKKIIKNNNIHIFSARDKYESKYKLDDWKKYAFRNFIKRKMRSFIQNIFSIGDGIYEHNALLSLHDVNYINNNERIMYLKSIKLKEKPSHATIIKQIDKLENILPNIHKQRKCKNHKI
jgi:hypothetical protein